MQQACTRCWVCAGKGWGAAACRCRWGGCAGEGWGRTECWGCAGEGWGAAVCTWPGGAAGFAEAWGARGRGEGCSSVRGAAARLQGVRAAILTCPYPSPGSPPPPIPPPVPPWRCAPWTAFSSLPTRMSSWGGSPRSWSTSCCRGSTTGRGTVWHRGVRALPCIGPMGFAWRGWEPWQLLQPGCRALCCRAPILPEDAQSIIWLCPGFESDLTPDAVISDGPEMAKNMGGFSWDGVAQFRDPVS